MTEQITMIPARLKNAAVNGHVAGAADIIDDAKAKTQNVINQDVDTAIGDDDVEGSIKGRIKALEEAVGPGGSVEEQIDAKVATLDASVSKTAGADGLALSVTEVDGIVTSVSGSIAANTYDAYGSASAEATRAKGAEGTIATNLSNEITRAQGAEQQNASDIDAIEAKIPAQASSTNQLADKKFVNSSISSSTATFRGTSKAGLTEQQFLAWANTLTKDANDYVFWNTADAAGNVQFKRYKYNGTTWVYEYTLNNSSFTSKQWAAIQSGITSALTTKLSALPTNAELNTLLAEKVDKVTGKGLSTNDYTTNEKNKLAGIAAGAEVNVQSDWNATSGDAFIKNKPTIPAAQVNSDWNATSGVAQILNKPTIPAAAANGKYTVKTLVGSTTTNVSDFTANQSSADDVTFVQGSNVTITPDATNRKITIAAKDTTYSSKTAASGGTDVSLVTTGEKYAWNNKQDALVSGTNIKTINSQSLLGSGDIVIEGGGSDVDVNYDTTNKKITKTIDGTTTDVVTAAKIVTDGGGIKDISGKVDKTTTVNGHALRGNVSVTKSDVGLGNVGNFKAVSTVASQGLSNTEKSNARANIGAGTSSFSGSYNDLSNKPTIPSVAQTTGQSTTAVMSQNAVTNALSGKADEATTISGYGITDAYTKTEVDSKINEEKERAQSTENSKANKAITLSGYGIEDAYTKDEVNNIVAPLVPTKNLYGGSWEVGCLHSNGVVYPEHTQFLTSNFIPMKNGDELVAKINQFPQMALYPFFCYYDSNKNLLQSAYQSGGIGYARTVFGTTGYMRVSVQLSGNYWIFYGKSITATYDQLNAIATGAVSPFNAMSRLYNKKVGFLGDSIIAYNHIVNAYQLKTHCVAVNYGISGTTISGTGSDAMCVRYANMANDLDMVIVLGGVNDHRSGIPLGEFKYYNSDGALNNTFYGALHTLMRGLKEKYPTKPIVFMTPMHNSYRDAQYGDTGDYNYAQFQNGILVENKFPLVNGTTIDDSVATGGILTEYVDAIKKVAAFYSIFVIDLYAISSLQPLLDSNKSRYLPDGIHPDEHGGKRISDIIYPYLEDMFEE